MVRVGVSAPPTSPLQWSQDHYPPPDVGQFTSLPCLYLRPHGLKIPLHSVHSDRNAIDLERGAAFDGAVGIGTLIEEPLEGHGVKVLARMHTVAEQ
jgi:hypothetical protein